MYGQGRSISKDTSTALFWYRKAAQRGDNNAAAALERLQIINDGLKNQTQATIAPFILQCRADWWMS